jgi:hypothetical protein
MLIYFCLGIWRGLLRTCLSCLRLQLKRRISPHCARKSQTRRYVLFSAVPLPLPLTIKNINRYTCRSATKSCWKIPQTDFWTADGSGTALWMDSIKRLHFFAHEHCIASLSPPKHLPFPLPLPHVVFPLLVTPSASSLLVITHFFHDPCIPCRCF